MVKKWCRAVLECSRTSVVFWFRAVVAMQKNQIISNIVLRLSGLVFDLESALERSFW